MENIPKNCLKQAAGEKMSNVLIKQEVEWLAEDTHARDLANQDDELDMESTKYIKTEEDPYHTNAESHKIQAFTPLSPTDGCIKAEFILDEEFRDKMCDSEANCKQLALPQAEVTSIKSNKEVCGSSFTQNANPNLHNSKHLDKTESITPFECEICSRAFTTKSNLRRHLATHSENGQLEFRCDLCERRFAKQHGLRIHQKAHSRIRSKGCEACGSSFANLKNHMLKKHLGKAPSNTPIPQTTDEEFLDATQESGAQRNESHSDIKGEACEVCHCIFPTEYMGIHKRLKHSKPKHKCKFCPRLFKQEHALKVHLSTHDPDRKRDFTCDICEKAFYSKIALYGHKKAYAEKDHVKVNCEVCASSFTRRGDLYVHMLTKHQIIIP